MSKKTARHTGVINRADGTTAYFITGKSPQKKDETISEIGAGAGCAVI